MIPISVRADFDVNGNMIPLHYYRDGLYVRIDRIILVVDSGIDIEYKCRCKDDCKRLLFTHSKWYLIDSEE